MSGSSKWPWPWSGENHRQMSEITRGTVWFRVGPPRRLAGLETHGYAVRFGVLPPPVAGPARMAALEAEGQRLLAEARRGYGAVLAQVLIAAGSTVPPPVDLDRPWSPDTGRALVTARRARWQETRQLLDAAAGQFSLSSPSAPKQRGAAFLGGLEEKARGALNAAVDAFDHLEDTNLASDAHAWAHMIGEMVAGLFGCRAKRQNDRWFDVCRLSLMHLRVGLSAGFVARRLCSICDRDQSSLPACGHTHGTTYSRSAARLADGSCTICGNLRCLTHTPGESYPVLACAQVRDVDRLDDISPVPRPRDPLARYTAIEIPDYAVAHLPNHDAKDASLFCEWCVTPCTGFTSAEEAFGFA
jgi:hypothetical protein